MCQGFSDDCRTQEAAPNHTAEVPNVTVTRGTNSKVVVVLVVPVVTVVVVAVLVIVVVVR